MVIVTKIYICTLLTVLILMLVRWFTSGRNTMVFGLVSLKTITSPESGIIRMVKKQSTVTCKVLVEDL